MMMKVAVLFLVGIALVHSAPEKRVFFDSFLDLSKLKQDVQLIIDVIGTDGTEQACERECHVLIQNPTNLLHQGCPLICHSLQELVHRFHLVPDTTMASATTTTS